MVSGVGQALLTGGSQILGCQIALELAGVGYDIVLQYDQPSEHIDTVAADIRALGLGCDLKQECLTDAQTAADLFVGVASKGPITCVINCFPVSGFDVDAQVGDKPGLPFFDLLGQAVPKVHTSLARLLYQSTFGGDKAVVVNVLDQSGFSARLGPSGDSFAKASFEEYTKALALSLANKVRVLGLVFGQTIPLENLRSEQGLNRDVDAHELEIKAVKHLAQTARFLIESPSLTGVTLVVNSLLHERGFKHDLSELSS